MNTRLQGLFFFVLAFLLYANTLGHGFVLDDQATLTENRWVQEGVSGIPKLLQTNSYAGFLPEDTPENLLEGGRYRPLTLVAFAVLKQFFGTSKAVFHLFAVLLYAINCLLLFRVLLLALKPEPGKVSEAGIIAFGATLLFTVHPVHTEVVANIKSCDEQLAMLCALGSLLAAFKAVDTRKILWNITAGTLFFLACLAKESAAPFLLLIPAAIWVFRGKEIIRSRTAWGTSIVLLLAFAAYFVVRGLALNWNFEGQGMHDPLNNPFLKQGETEWIAFTPLETAATIFYTLLEYLRLLVWPHPLTHDYYPFWIEPQTFSETAVLVAVGLYTLLTGFAIWGFVKRKITGFGLLFYLLSLLIVANIFVPVGTFMAERFLFIPSVGFCLALTAFLVWIAGRLKRSPALVMFVLVPVALVFGILTVARNPAWSDNKTLLQTDLTTSPNSAKLRNSLGTILLDEALKSTNPGQRQELFEASAKQLSQALKLHPSYYDAMLACGACVFYLQNFEGSIAAYRQASRINPEDPKASTGLYYALRYGGEYYLANRDTSGFGIQYLLQAWELQPDTAVASRLASYYNLVGQPTEATLWLEKALSLSPDDARLRNAVSEAYRAAGQPGKAEAIENQSQSFRTFSPEGN